MGRGMAVQCTVPQAGGTGPPSVARHSSQPWGHCWALLCCNVWVGSRQAASWQRLRPYLLQTPHSPYQPHTDIPGFLLSPIPQAAHSRQNSLTACPLHTCLLSLMLPKCITPESGPSLGILSKQTKAGR